MSTTRKCPHCQAVVEGRPNKVFCSTFCKGQHHRENTPPPQEAVSAFRFSALVPAPLAPVYPVDASLAEEEDQRALEQQVRTAAAIQAQTDYKHAADLHAQFCRVVQDFLAVEGQPLTARALRRLFQQTERLTQTYRAHPYLKVRGMLVRHRLQELYEIGDLLEAVGQQISEKGVFENKEESFTLKKKWRQELRNLLIAD